MRLTEWPSQQCRIYSTVDTRTTSVAKNEIEYTNKFTNIWSLKKENQQKSNVKSVKWESTQVMDGEWQADHTLER